MIEIITGPRDSGKTSHLLNLYNQTQAGDGLLSIKHLHPVTRQTSGYRLLHLSSQTSHTLAQRTLHNSTNPPDIDNYQLGNFTFNPEAFAYAHNLLDSLLGQNIRPIYLDEIGLLELNGLGFAPILPRLVTAAPHLVLTIRNRYLAEALKTFHITSPIITKT